MRKEKEKRAHIGVTLELTISTRLAISTRLEWPAIYIRSAISLRPADHLYLDDSPYRHNRVAYGRRRLYLTHEAAQ